MQGIIISIFIYIIQYNNFLKGHDGEISKVEFNPKGTKIITAGVDKTARIWSAETCDCL